MSVHFKAVNCYDLSDLKYRVDPTPEATCVSNTPWPSGYSPTY